MLQAIERICRYTKGKNFEDFIADDMMYYAVVKNIEILGEASNMLTLKSATIIQYTIKGRFMSR